MKKLKVSITGCLGRMGTQLIKTIKKNKQIQIVSVTEGKIGEKRKIGNLKIQKNSINAFKNTSVIIDFTTPNCTIEVLKIAKRLRKKVVIGTTGFGLKQEKYIKNISKFIPVLKAGNMSLGINVLIYLAELTSKSLGSKYLIKIMEEHHKHKKDYPSGTALMLGEGAAKGRGKSLKNIMGKKSLNKNNFPFGKKINFSSKRKGEIVGNHSVLFSNNMEVINLTHNAYDRSLYSEGALHAAQWLTKKRPGYYSMRDVLNI
ncbi:MAG: 4-hydroxy-tetrahydrodipicolinate reductase [Pelagibacteraceae bacterium]|nr:MAG: 4-hydroxy-tetrahydrodipicolinate reductase [Pelagibacteraceae bacterium]